MTLNATTIRSSSPVTPLHAAVEVGSVTLKVADLHRSIAFYTDLIGLTTLTHTEKAAILGAGTRPIVSLVEVANPQPQSRNATGLFHAAILFPDRHALAIKIMQLAAHHLAIGSGEHLVSEAFYLDDPDGNGLELYRDRPRSEWTWTGDRVQMATEAIDFDSFFGEVHENDPALADSHAPVGTKLGHIHLKVADIPQAGAFYHGVLGFEVVAQMSSALFVSAGGYHHHIGLNTWQSRGGQPTREPSVGLQEFSLRLPDQAERDRLLTQITVAGIAVDRTADDPVVRDPFQNRIRLTIS